MGHTLDFLVQHGYLLLFVWLLLEQAVLPLPSVPLLLACGALARMGKLDPRLILLYGMSACMIADNVWFQLGRRRGGRILRLICRVALEPDSCVRRTENSFIRYGMASLLVSKFVPGLNAVAAPLAGSSGARRTRFLLFDAMGILIWISSYVALGYLFSGQLETVAGYAARTGSGLLLLVVGLPAAWFAWKFLQRRRFLKKLSVARITAGELRDMLRRGEEVLIVDVRSSLASDAGSIPGAVHIPAEELPVRRSEIPRDRDIVLFCT